MTTISLLGGDWEYQFEDETTDPAANVGTRMLVYVSGVVRSTNEVYSALADVTDEFQAMGFKNPMLPVTPNAYTMENKAFISRASSEQLKEGTITADWALVGVAGNDAGRGVLRVPYTGGTNFDSGDVGKLVTQGDSGDTGTLLDFEIEPDGTLVAWIRPDDSTPTTGDIFDGTGTLVVTNGTGSSTSSTAATSGQTRFTAIQAIGSVPTATEVYVVQNRIKLKDAVTDSFQFWATDTAVSLGIVSVLIRTQSVGALIADGDLEVFARRYTSLYDNFRLNVAAGGFSALPLASAPDINNTIGYRRNVMTGSGGTWTVGNALYVGASWAAATIKGVITAEDSGTIEYYLIGDLTDLTGSEAIKEYDFVAEGDGDATATGAAGGSIPNLLGPTDPAATQGGSVTITNGNTTRDHDNTGVAEPYSVIIDAQGDVPIAKVYERIKYVTRRGADAADLFGAGVNVPGETYRGLEGLYYYDGLTSGPFGEGEDIDHNGGTWTARSIAVRTTVVGEDVAQIYFTTTDEQTSLDSVGNNDQIDDESSSSVDIQTDGAGGAALSISSPKSSPFGTFTGSQIFGAQGIDFRNPGPDDTQAYILTDDLGTLRTPPNTLSFTVANTRAADRILVARDTGTSGVIDKDQFGGIDTPGGSYNSIDDAEVRAAGTVDGEVPTIGVVRVVETTLEEEHRYYYSSRTTGSNGVFTLKAIANSPFTATAGSTTQVVDDGENFVTNGVEVGMLIRNTFGGKTTHIWEVTGFAQTGATPNDTLLLRPLYGSPDDFDVGDTFTINLLIQTYATSDDVYDTILDYEEDVGDDVTPGSIVNTFVKLGGTFGTVVQVRQGKVILPFEQNQDQGQGNTTVTTVRTPDSIAV